MKNPIGPYPGRQLFTGLTREGNPCFAYLVTGRSPESRERKAIQLADKIAVGPLGTTEYDPLRHYTAVQSDKTSGVLAVSNGIQTEAIFETYRLLFNVKTQPSKDFLEKIMEGAAAEPDSLHTPRIGAIVTGLDGKPISFVSIKRHDSPAKAFEVNLQKGKMTGIPVYDGSMETPGPFDPTRGLPTIDLPSVTAKEIAAFLFDISAASNKGMDIRVCAVGGVRVSNDWQVAIVNAH
jgi:IMP cyclohydrolase